MSPLCALARLNLNLLLKGVPGTGKTRAFNKICDGFSPKIDRRFVLNCHPSTQYEDVIEGLRPKAVKLPGDERAWTSVESPPKQAHEGNQSKSDDRHWHVVDGVFLRACTAARHLPKGRFAAILLDELNRANVPRILGDLMTAIERSKRVEFNDNGEYVPKTGKDGEARDMCPLTLPLSGRTFLVPDNLIVVATMNSVDQSVAPLDQALLRRFWPVTVPVLMDEKPAEGPLTKALNGKGRKTTETGLHIHVNQFVKLNEALKKALGDDGMVGHSFLFEMKHFIEDAPGADSGAAAVENVWKYGVAHQVIEALRAAGKDAKWPATESDSIKDNADLEAVREKLVNAKIGLIADGSGQLRQLRLANP